VPGPRSARVSKKVITAQLKTIFKQTNDHLRKILDPHMPTLRASQPDLYLGYQSSRIIIDRRGPSTPDNEPQVIEALIPMGTVVNLSVTDVSATDIITAENLGTTGLQLYFSALPTDLPPMGTGVVAAGATEGGTATEAGFEAGVRESLNVYNLGPGGGSIRVTIEGA